MILEPSLAGWPSMPLGYILGNRVHVPFSIVGLEDDLSFSPSPLPALSIKGYKLCK